MSTETKIENINIDNIFPSTTNPRKGYDVKALEELSKSIKEHGVLQPIMVRTIPDSTDRDGSPKYEIIYGERRFKASILAGMKTIKAQVKELDDDKAFEIQVLENLQREDINPLDEARAFQSLMKKESLDWLASKINKSKKYVLDRIKLLDLCNEALSALEAGVLPLGHAVLLSKIEIEKQEKIIKTSNLFLGHSIGEGTSKMYCSKTLAQLKDAISNTMLSFGRVNFDLDDADLITKAGSCQDCPKRTINQNLLFGDITEKDLCTDSFCYNAKIQKQININLEKAKTQFGEILVGEKESWSSHGVIVNKERLVFNEEKTDKYSVPVLINKTSDYETHKLGKTVWVEDKSKEVEVETEIKTSGPSSWELRSAKEFDELTVPRFSELIGACSGSPFATTKVANAYLVEKFTEINLEKILIIAHFLEIKPLENLSYFDILKLTKDKTRAEDYDMCFEFATAIVKKCSLELALALLAIDDLTTDDFAETELVPEWELTITKIYKILGLDIPVESEEVESEEA